MQQIKKYALKKQFLVIHSLSFSYVVDGQLEYNLSPKDSGTIMLRTYTNTKTDKQYFLEGKRQK